jgi:hypothetical protein
MNCEATLHGLVSEWCKLRDLCFQIETICTNYRPSLSTDGSLSEIEAMYLSLRTLLNATVVSIEELSSDIKHLESVSGRLKQQIYALSSSLDRDSGVTKDRTELETIRTYYVSINLFI